MSLKHSALNDRSSFVPKICFGKENNLGGWNFTSKISISDKDAIEIVRMSLYHTITKYATVTVIQKEAAGRLTLIATVMKSVISKH